MDYYHQSATENQVAHGLSHELYYQEKHWLEIHPLSGETSKTSARVVDKSYIGDKGASEYSASYMESCGVSESATSYSIDHYGGPYYLEVSQISDQSPIPFQGSSQMSLKKYSLNPDIDPTMKETVLQDPLSIEQTQSEPDRMREETASKTGHTLQSLNFPSNSPGKGSILKKTNRGKESKIKKKTKLQQQDLLKDNENCHGDEVPPFLKNTCPDEERFVFECLWHHRHKPNQDIWDSIQDDFFKRFRQNHSREVLHMKFSRAKSKYIQWISKDVSPASSRPN